MDTQSTSRRHCMVVHAYYPLGESRVEREAQALISRGYLVDILCLRDTNEPAVATGPGYTIYRLPLRRGLGRGLAARLLEYLRFFLLVFFKLLSLYPRRRYPVIQVHNLPDFLVFAAIIPKLLGARLILDLHDLMPEFFAASFGSRTDNFPVRLVKLQERLACRFADHVITVTEPWRKKLIQRGVPAEKISVVMNVADDRVFQPLPAHRRPPRQPGQFRLIYHGTLVQRYGVDVLIRAVGLAQPHIPHISLTLQGTGEYLSELYQLVERLELQDHVHIHAFNRHVTELPGLIAEADAGVVPNRNDPFTDELLPTKLLEYVALNIPVIAARTQGIRAYFDDHMLEFFTPGDAASLARSIERLHDEPERLATLANNAHTFNRQFPWAALAAEYAALVERLGAPARGQPESINLPSG